MIENKKNKKIDINKLRLGDVVLVKSSGAYGFYQACDVTRIYKKNNTICCKVADLAEYTHVKIEDCKPFFSACYMTRYLED